MSDDNREFNDNGQPDSPADDSRPQSSGSTTHDLRGEAEEALRRYNLEHIIPRRAPSASVPCPQPSEMTLRVEIRGMSTPMMLSLSGEAVVGRRDPLSEQRPDIDLTPYGGYQMGISRRHAMLCLREDGLELIDLGSRNGTYLNGERLQGHQPARLQSGDELRLGKIVMVVYLEPAS